MLEAGSVALAAADAIADAITALSRLACDLGDALTALDINPLICTPRSAGYLPGGPAICLQFRG